MNALISFILLITPFLSGCNDPSPPVPPVVLPANTNYEAFLSWEIALSLPIGNSGGNAPQPAPSPTPSIKIGDKCPKCEGTGKLDGDKDGVVDSACRYCREDGRVDEGDPILGTGAVAAVEKSAVVVVGPLDENTPQPPATIQELTDATFNEVMHSPFPVLIETYGAGCTPCLALSADLKRINATYGAQIPIYRMSVDTNPGGKKALASTRIPGLYLVHNNQMLCNPLIGYHGLSNTIAWIKQRVPLSP